METSVAGSITDQRLCTAVRESVRPPRDIVSLALLGGKYLTEVESLEGF